MPHLVILYTGQLDTEVDMTALCRQMADAMLTVKDEEGKQVFPTGGTRVLAYPAPHYAVADGGAAGKAAGGTGDYAFVYLNVRMGRGRTEATQQRAGQILVEVAKAFFAPAMGGICSPRSPMNTAWKRWRTTTPRWTPSTARWCRCAT